MKINKKEALALAKVLHQHTGSALAIVPQSEHDETVRELAARLDRFIMVDGADADYVDEDYRPRKSTTKEAQPCDFFEDGDDDDEDVDDEDDDEDEEEGGEMEAAVDLEVEAGDLHDLTPAKATAGTVEFEHVPGAHANPGHVDLLLDGETTLEYVTHLRRHGKSLEVKAEDRAWTTFEVSRFPKGWATLLPAGELASVEEDAR